MGAFKIDKKSCFMVRYVIGFGPDIYEKNYAKQLQHSNADGMQLTDFEMNHSQTGQWMAQSSRD